MRNDHHISVIIPALNEAQSIGKVLDAIPVWVDDVIVGDNGSTDGTPGAAEANGARVVHEPRRGYGSACLRALDALGETDIVVFLDADFSDHPDQMDRLVDPVVADEADLVIGSRTLGNAAKGALTPQARFGNRLACFLMRLFWGVRYTDLGPFRAIRRTALDQIVMADPDYGWTVEMQIKAALHGLRSQEAPVDYRKRIGRSKVSGTVRGVVGAGYKILSTIFLSAARFYLSGKKIPQSQALIILTRYPTPGETKTRLIPALGPEGAAELQRQMTEHALGIARRSRFAAIEVRYTGADERAMVDWLGEGPRYRVQAGGDLGARMANAFEETFVDGTTRAIITGVDSPEISASIHRAAFGALEKHDLVLGPATDGGYYLIGMRRDAAMKAIPGIFEDVDWGLERVLEQTLERAGELGVSVRLLAPLDDVDRPDDLPAWERARADLDGSPERPTISVIIPALNEADRIAATVERVLSTDSVEVIVVDGGSDDDTRETAEAAGATVIAGPRGRAEQMNFGSAKASADVLLFLHADTLPPADYAECIKRELAKPGAIAGAFRFETDVPGVLMKLIAVVANLRSTLLRLPYGDQGLFLTKDRFREMGGFERMPIMEDFDMVRRLARTGRVAIAPATAVTCGRRWREVGPWKTTLVNQTVVLLHYLGVSPERLAALYGRTRRRG